MKTDITQVQKVCRGDLDISIGSIIFLKAKEADKKYHMHFVGMHPTKYLIVRPVEPLLPPELEMGSSLIVRFKNKSVVCGFTSKVIYTITTPAPLIFLEHPECYEILNLRKSHRVACFLEATISWQDRVWSAKIINISSTGCQIVLDLNLDKVSCLKQDDEVYCQFHFEGRKFFIKSNIRKKTALDKKMKIGVQFAETTKEFQSLVDNYIISVNEYMGTDAGNPENFFSD